MAHTIEQPGLYAHSWRPEDDLMKRYRVDKQIVGPLGEPKGWLAISSWNTEDEAWTALIAGENEHHIAYRIVDNFNNDYVLAQTPDELINRWDAEKGMEL